MLHDLCPGEKAWPSFPVLRKTQIMTTYYSKAFMAAAGKWFLGAVFEAYPFFQS